MEQLAQFLAALIKIGVVGAALLAGGVYAAYVVESRCANPLGCIDPVQVRESTENDKFNLRFERGEHLGTNCPPAYWECK